MKRLVFVVALMTSGLAFAQSSTTLEIKGVVPGVTTKTEIQERYPEASCPDVCVVSSNMAVAKRCASAGHPATQAGMDCRRQVETDLQFGPAWALRYDFHFAGDTVSSAHVLFTENWFPEVVAALTAKYGKPTNARSAVVQNRMGATFASRIVTWKRGGLTLVAEQRAREVDRSEVSVVSTELEKRAARSALQQARDTAKSL